MIKKLWIKWKMKYASYRSLAVLKRIANLPVEARVSMTEDEQALLRRLVEKLEPSQFITRNGKITYLAPDLEHVTLWDMLETRRAEDSVARIHSWTGGAYSPDTVTDCIRLDKYIIEQLKNADELENYIFNRPAGVSSAEADKDPIKEAKTLLGLVQITSELFQCSFEEAKKVNYSDSVLAMAKRMEEVEKEKQKLKNQKQ